MERTQVYETSREAESRFLRGCDGAASGAETAVCVAVREMRGRQEIRLCAHHATQCAPRLRRDGFKFWKLS